MVQAHKSGRRNETHFEPERVAEGAIGVGKAEEQIRVLLEGTANEAAVRQQDFQFLDRLVDQAKPERRGFDPDAADRAANGDGFELRNDGREQTELQSFVDQFRISGHSFDIGDAIFDIDPQNMM